MFDLEKKQDALHLSPVAEADMVADIAAAIGALCGLDPGVITKTLNKCSGVVVAPTIDHDRKMHSVSESLAPQFLSHPGPQPTLHGSCQLLRSDPPGGFDWLNAG